MRKRFCRFVILVDLDGTLNFCPPQKIDWNDRRACNELMNNHRPNKLMIKINNSLYESMPDHFFFIVTARPNAYRTVTQEWLLRHDVSYDGIYMRSDDDLVASDKDVKLEIFNAISRIHEVVLVIDDRGSNVRMFREQGVQCLHCSEEGIQYVG